MTAICIQEMIQASVTSVVASAIARIAVRCGKDLCHNGLRFVAFFVGCDVPVVSCSATHPGSPIASQAERWCVDGAERGKGREMLRLAGYWRSSTDRASERAARRAWR